MKEPTEHDEAGEAGDAGNENESVEDKKELARKKRQYVEFPCAFSPGDCSALN